MPALNLDIKNEEDRQRAITQANQLRKHPCWKLYVAYAQSLVELWSSDIMTVGGNDKEFTHRDLLILQKQFVEKAIHFPEDLIDALSSADKKGPVEDFDPWADA